MKFSLPRLGTVAALLCFAVPALAPTADRGALPEKHDSNSLHKLGQSVQYPVRKARENVSKNGSQRHDAVVTSSGQVKSLPKQPPHMRWPPEMGAVFLFGANGVKIS